VEANTNSTEPEFTPLFSNEAVRDLAFFEDVRHLRFNSEIETYEAQLSEESDWQERYDALYMYISASTAGRFLGTSAKWVTNHANQLGYEPILTESGTGHPIHGYKKEMLPELRDLLKEAPLQGDWLSLLDLQDRTGVDRMRSKHVLANHGVASERRRSNENKIVGQFYPPESEAVVLEEKNSRPKPAGDWKTDRAIAKMLGRDETWVFARTAQYQNVSEIRTTAKGQEAVHHSPAIVELLKMESDNFDAVPYATPEDIALRALAISVKRGDIWVFDRIPYTRSEVSTKRNPASHRTYMYITPNPHDDLIDMPDNILELDPKEYLEQRSEWIESELEVLERRKTLLNFSGVRIKQVIELERQRREVVRQQSLAREARQSRKVSLGPTIPLRNEDMNGRAWQDFAACLQADPEIFFPEKGDSNKDAKKVCASCRVAEQCLEHALEHNETIGIWAGTTPENRRKMKQSRQRSRYF
jgi:WhiB family redox-sensing transcriptional regulator